MKGLLSTQFVLSVFASGTAYAQPRSINSVPAASQFSAVQPMDETSRGKELYYGYSEDVSNARYWSTPKEAGGGAELGGRSRAPGR